jgi:hypothetical protein
MQKELNNNKDEDDLVKFFDYTLTVLDKKILRIIENDIEFLSKYYIHNITKLLNPKYKIDICNHMNKYMSEIEAKDAYKFIITNNRGYNMLYDLIKKEFNINPHEYIINNLIHYYINDILDY